MDFIDEINNGLKESAKWINNAIGLIDAMRGDLEETEEENERLKEQVFHLTDDLSDAKALLYEIEQQGLDRKWMD